MNATKYFRYDFTGISFKKKILPEGKLKKREKMILNLLLAFRKFDAVNLCFVN